MEKLTRTEYDKIVREYDNAIEAIDSFESRLFKKKQIVIDLKDKGGQALNSYIHAKGMAAYYKREYEKALPGLLEKGEENAEENKGLSQKNIAIINNLTPG